MSTDRDPTQDLSPLKRALFAVRDLKTRLEAVERARVEPIAIVGMACRFPGAPDVESFWRLLDQGVDALREVPPDRWDVNALYDPDPDAPGKTCMREGGFLDEVTGFDAAFFGIPPREVLSMDPQQRLLLEVAWEALEDAGLPVRSLAGTSAGVFVGLGTNDYVQRTLHSGNPERLDSYSGTGGAGCVAAGRISYLLGFHGPTVAVDTACSSALVAVDLAVQHLRAGRCGVALAGGVSLMLSPTATVYLSKVRALSPTNRCRTFDASADGYVRGEGCGLVVLKRLSDAERDGDRILAVVRGSASNHDGRSSGLTVPNGQAQQAVIRQALTDAGLAPNAVHYVEAHGTGTPLGDPIELRALDAVLGVDRDRDHKLLVGSVKTNIGHLEAAAGVAGIIKVVLAMQHGRIPPTLHLTHPTPHVPWDELKLAAPISTTPWPEPSALPVAGVSAFGFSGTNAHVLLEGTPARQPGEPATPIEDRAWHVVTLSAATPTALQALGRRYEALCAGGDAVELADLASSANTGRSALEHRAAVVGQSAAQVAEGFRAVAEARAHPTVASERARTDRPRVAFLFTGQGAQSAGMGRELYRVEPVFRDALDRCAEVLQPHLERPLLHVLFEDETGALLNQTGYTQPALFAVEYALACLWRSWGVEPSFVAGHSLGEYVAACVAGFYSLEDGLRLVATRARLMQALAPGGRMASVFAAEPLVAQAIAGEPLVSIAAINGPEQTVVSGDGGAVDAVLARLAARDIASKALVVSHAFHSPLMEPMLDEFERAVAEVRWTTPRARLVSNLTGRVVAPAEVSTPAYWRRHLREPVQFAASVHELRDRECTVFLEIGPHPTLVAMAARCVPGDGAVFLPSLRRGQGDVEALARSVASAWVNDVVVDWRAMDRDRPRRRVTLPTYPFERQRYWLEEEARGAARVGDLPRLHSLLHERLRSPKLTGPVFQSRLGLASVPYLRDHQVFATPVVPAAVYLEMARAACRQILGSSEATIVDVAIEEPLALEDDADRLVQVVVAPGGEGLGFEIFSQPSATDAPDAWTRHVTGRFGTGESTSSVPVELDALRARCAERVAIDDYYLRLTDLGIVYGQAFRGVSELWRGDGECLARLRLADDIETAVDEVHPILLDASLQAMGAAFTPENGSPSGDDLYLPVGVARMQVPVAPQREAWCHVRVSGDYGSAAETLSAEIRCYDGQGRALFALAGVTVKRASREAVRRAIAGRVDCLYELAWRPVSLTADPADTRVGGRWLVLADGTGIGTALGAELAAAGAHPFLAGVEGTSHPHDRLDSRAAALKLIDAAIADGPLEGIVHVWGVEEREVEHDVEDAEALETRAASLCASVAHLVQALSDRSDRAGSPRLFIVTRGAHAVARAGQPDVDAGQAALWGMGRVIAVEHPELRWTGLDLDPTEPLPPATLLPWLLAADGEPQVARRNGERFVARLVRATRAEPRQALSVDRDGLYLVTGGLGGLGSSVAQWLAGRAGEVMLTGRSAPGPAAAAAIAQIESAGTRVSVVRADVSSVEGAETLRLAIVRTGRALKGIVHAAGVLDDAPVLEQDYGRLSKVMAPKVRGAWHLHELSADQPLDFFALFSSATAILGTPGQSNYAAANACMDAVADKRHAAGLPAISINWGGWDEVGMVARLGDVHRQRIMASGVAGISVDLGLRVFEQLAAQASPHAIVLPVKWRQLLQQFAPDAVPPLLAEMARDVGRTATPRPAAQSDLPRRLSATGSEDRAALLLEYTRGQVARVLGLTDPTLVDATRSFSELGLDSLMMVELRNALAAAVGRTLPTSLLYDHGTVESVVAALTGESGTPAAAAPAAASDEGTREAASLLERLDELSDEHVDALLGTMLGDAERPDGRR